MALRPSRAVARPRPVEDEAPYRDNETACSLQADAIDRQTAAIRDLVSELRQTRVALTPAAEALHSLGDAQRKLCNFLVNNRLKLVAGLLAALVAVGAISPNAATVLGSILKGLGVS